MRIEMRLRMVWYGLVWFDMVWYGLVWFGIEYDLVCSRMFQNVLDDLSIFRVFFDMSLHCQDMMEDDLSIF